MNIRVYTKQFLSDNLANALAVVACLLIFIGFTCSRALVSIGMIVLIIAPLIHQPPKIFLRYFKCPELWILSFFFFIVLLSGLYSADKADWLKWVRIKLPYLVLPIAFAGLKQLSKKSFTLILYGFMLTFCVSTIVILFGYYSNYAAITESFLRGSALDIPFSHIRYSLMLCFSFFCGIYLLQQKLFLFHPKEKYLQLFLSGVAFVALHILSVRSGLVALYIGLLYLAVRFMVTEKKFVIGTAIIALSVSVPIAAYFLVPSLHNKISYMRYDVGEYSKGEINDNSDAMRLASMKIGLTIWQQYPLIGCGAGDLQAECTSLYQRDYPLVSTANYRLPHNQFIWVLATTGSIGFILFLIAFFVPFFITGLYRHWLAVVFSLSLFSSFFTEHSLEEQMGTGFYLIFLLLMMNQWGHEE